MAVMKRYFTIAELERYTDIKAHTFRTWEQRYEMLKSKRKTNNLRYYTISDLDFFLDFSLLNRYGYKVSKLAAMKPEEVRETVFLLENETAKKENIVHKLIVHMFSLEVDAFESILDHAISKYGINEAMEDVILSFIEKIDLFSYKGNSSTEYHFATTVLRKKIIVGIEQAKGRGPLSKTALLFLPEGEHFDLLLLYIHYKFQLAGIKSFYLGTNIQFQDLSIAVEKKQPDFLVTYLHHEEKKAWNKLLSYLPCTEKQLLFVTRPIIDSPQGKLDASKIKFAQYRSIVEEVEGLEMPLEKV